MEPSGGVSGMRFMRKVGKCLLPAVIVFLSAVLATPADVLAEDINTDEAEFYLQQGEESFRAGMELDSTDPEAARDHYLKAILNFERIIREGKIRNGRLYYNTGNAWFRLGDLGKAIVNYKRARLYRPNDRNIRQNLEFARSRRINRVDITERERVFKTLFFLHYDISSRIRLMIFIISSLMIWATATMWLFVRKSRVRALFVIFVIVSSIFLTSLTVEIVGRAHKPAGVIVSGEVTARKGDAETYQQSFTEPLYSGTEFRVLEKRTDWWYIELEDGARCWIPSGAGNLVIDW